MSTSPDTSAVSAFAPRESVFHRILRSNAFAVALSVALHAVLLFGMYKAVFREEGTSRQIVPETRLMASSGRETSVRSEPLRIAEKVESVRPQPVAVDPRALALPDVRLATPTGVPDEPSMPSAAASDGASSGDVPLMASDGMGIQLFGVSGNANRVVYVVDVSISLSLVAPQLKSELRASVDALRPAQSFQIVLAKPYGQIEEFTRGRLVPALTSHKARSSAFIDKLFTSTRPGRDRVDSMTFGGADPVRAMTRAFSSEPRPELIYFLTDGSYQNLEDKLLARLDALNPERDVSITVICLPGDVFNPDFLRTIAKTHGGHYREVLDR